MKLRYGNWVENSPVSAAALEAHLSKGVGTPLVTSLALAMRNRQSRSGCIQRQAPAESVQVDGVYISLARIVADVGDVDRGKLLVMARSKSRFHSTA